MGNLPREVLVKQHKQKPIGKRSKEMGEEAGSMII